MPRPGIVVNSVHNRLREDILSGHIQPGVYLSQVQLAERYGVSRTPLREALRMLQEEGIITATHNHRVRVREVNLDDVEGISAQRILLSSLATYITVSSVNWRAGYDLEACLERLEVASAAGDAEAWHQADLAFHSAHQELAPPSIRDDLDRLGQRDELYKTIWMRTDRHTDPQTVEEHYSIATASLAGDAGEAMRAVARHRARIGLSVMARAVPEREPATIRAALQVVLGSVAGSQLKPERHPLIPVKETRRAPSRTGRTKATG